MMNGMWLIMVLLPLSLTAITGAVPTQKHCNLKIDEKGQLHMTNCSIFYTKMILSKFVVMKPLLQLGDSKKTAAASCKALRDSRLESSSGIYWIDPNRGSHDDAFQAYCDQNTAGGGWTLVWSYTFTNYDSFKNAANAVTPRPSWSASSANVRVSTTAPLGETSYNAMRFDIWRSLGREILIKSNINNWILCTPGSGSLLLWRAGSLNCKLIKVVARKCPTVVPTKFGIDSYGPYLTYSSLYYYFDGSKGTSWPTHDPCGTNAANQVHGIANPHGNIYVR